MPRDATRVLHIFGRPAQGRRVHVRRGDTGLSLATPYIVIAPPRIGLAVVDTVKRSQLNAIASSLACSIPGDVMTVG